MADAFAKSEDIYAGISGLALGDATLDLGYGIQLRPIYAHLFAHFMVAFAHAPSGGPHPGPWKAARGGFASDIAAELHVPSATTAHLGSLTDIAHVIAFLIRLEIDPAASIATLSNAPLTADAQAGDQAWIVPYEAEHRRFVLAAVGAQTPDAASAARVAGRWPTALRFIKESSEFALAVDVLMIGQYVHRSALTIVSIWAALEAMFSPSSSELRFRVSALIAAYLDPPGQARRERAQMVSKLYDKRSSAAHGKSKHETDDVLHSFNLLREVLTKMLDEEKIPSKDDLDRLLYGQ